MSEPGATVGTLYLIPVSLGGDNAQSALPSATLAVARRLDTFVVENAGRDLYLVNQPATE